MRWIQGPGENRRLIAVQIFITLRLIVVEVVVLRGERVRAFVESLSNEEPMEDHGEKSHKSDLYKVSR